MLRLFRHEVVATVRSSAKGDFIAQKFRSLGKISFAVVEDITSQGAFDNALKASSDFDAVVHSASPFHSNITDARRDILDPAIKGTTGILHAIKSYAPQVRRVVITSSVGAMINFKNHPPQYGAQSWNPTTYEESLENFALTYNASKKFAELAAWDFMKTEKPNFTLATINPPFVFGPPIHDLRSLADTNTSNKRILSAIDGSFKKGVPPTGSWMWVDVRDVALAHVRAVERPEAGGHRFLMVEGYWTNKQMVDVIREYFPGLRHNLPDSVESDFPDKIFSFDNKPSIAVLGIKYHPFEQCIVDSVNGLLKVDQRLEKK